jgi:alcohol dehydrogenase class IV
LPAPSGSLGARRLGYCVSLRLILPKLPEPSLTAIRDGALALRDELKIPATLEGLGVGGERIDEIAEMAAEDPTAPTNAVPAGAAEMRQMFEAALEGRI